MSLGSPAVSRMNRIVALVSAGTILSGCADQYPYPGTINDAEQAIAAAPMGLTHVQVEARSDAWL